MTKKPTYEELEQRVRDLETEAAKHKQAEKALWESEHYFRSLLHSIHEDILVIDQNYQITDVNSTFLVTTGQKREEVIGCHCYEVSHGYNEPCDRRGEECMLRKVFVTGKPCNCRHEHIRTDGSKVWVDILLSPLRDDQGNITHVIEAIRDVTDLIQSQEALRESEERYRGLIEGSIQGILIHRNMKPLFVNQAYADISGDSVEEILKMGTILPHFMSHERSRLSGYNEARLRGEDVPIQYEYQGVRKDGSSIWLENRVRVVNWQGETAIQMTIFDITESKRTVEELKESEERFRAFAEAAPYGLSIMKPDKTFEYFNPKFTEIFGYTMEDTPDKNIWFEKVYPDKEYRDTAISIWKQKYLSEDTEAGEALPNIFTVRCKDGQEKIINFRNVTSNDGRHFLTYQDITVQARAEKALQESELWMRRMFNSLEEAVLIITPDRVVIDINEAGTRMFGYSRDELINHSTEILRVDHQHHLEFGRRTKDAFDKGRAARFEFDTKRKNGEIFPTERTISLLKSDEGKPMGIVSVIRDLSEQKRAEEEKKKLETQLQQAQRLEAIGTLAGGIAHDFNNLLMGIQGNASLMLLDMDSAHSHHEKLKTIEKHVQSGAKLTQQLLGYARKGRYEVMPMNLNQLIEETSNTFGRTRKEIMIHREIAGDLFTIDADQVQIEQVLLNLYVNAADAMPTGGDLILKTMNISHEDIKGKLYDPKPANYVLLTVTDTGSGMDKKTKEHIFEPFFTTKEMGRGTGLGLASTYGIIKAHGGYIDVESERGHGTTFNIYLPASEKEVAKEKEFPEDILKGTETVLFVDDEEIIIDVGDKMLKELGYTVLLAKSGKEAMDVYKEKQDKLDMVILDMIMPGIGGGETYDRMKEMNLRVKVLLSSGYSIDGQATEILERGCDGFIQKPFNIKELSQKLREILDKEKS